MRWQDEGILLAFSPFGEQNQIVSVLTEHHGRHKGLFKPTRRHQGTFNPGVIVDTQWYARLEEHLGSWQFEVIFSPLAWILHAPIALHALLSAIALIERILPEREPQPSLYQAFKRLIQAFRQGNWLQTYIFFELALIHHSGLPLNPGDCRVMDDKKKLNIYGEATVCRHGMRLAPYVQARFPKEGRPCDDKLQALSDLLLMRDSLTFTEAFNALDLTESFLERYSLGVHSLKMPEARFRFKDYLRLQQQRESA
jgi:DNA repair protein RecO (recombination protein O)